MDKSNGDSGTPDTPIYVPRSVHLLSKLATNEMLNVFELGPSWSVLDLDYLHRDLVLEDSSGVAESSEDVNGVTLI